jgi:hypothetical protein
VRQDHEEMSDYVRSLLAELSPNVALLRSRNSPSGAGRTSMADEMGSDPDREARIRRRAHQIWDESGRPEGRDLDHWQQATADIDAEDATANETADAPMTAATWKPQVEEQPTEGMRDETLDPVGGDSQNAPRAPKTGGGARKGKEPLVNPVADRNVEGPRQAGMTPRPTDKPIAGRRGT